MRTDTAPPVRLVDYRPPDFLVETVDLDIRLDPDETLVRARIAFAPNPRGRHDAPLVLDGDEVSLVSIALDNRPLSGDAYTADAQSLVVHAPPRRRFVLDVVTRIAPGANTKLMGLYRSGGVYCTQCEADGFRRIAYFPDRPDVLAVYTTRIEARRAEAPVLLSNGNLVAEGDVPGTDRHFAVWHDPFPKPAYLFALVGGHLGMVRDRFRTASGREVDLRIHVEPGKEKRCLYAMDALKRSMRWDEEAFGCEYDLDIFMIVAVSDFNMGAMENKGLNIFNDKYVLADPETATDGDYAAIEAIVAHEYFHNWTGNRITCRDWFQLCLKEGLTVFRDQEFTSDQRSRAVKRITDVRTLRAAQFVEDSGPLAHPVRPEIYHEINNFYTATVYEKGAEVIRMLKVLIGDEAFRQGMDLYLRRCDGTAATVENFIACFAEASGRDLTHFMRWYSQAGTPTVTVRGEYDPAARSFAVEFTQATPPTPGQPDKEPLVIPIRLGFVAPDGRDAPVKVREIEGASIAGDVIAFDTAQARVVFEGFEGWATPSLFRGFSAPVRIDVGYGVEDLVNLMRNDSDRFNRWQATQTIAARLLVDRATGRGPAQFDPRFAQALRETLRREADPAFCAQCLALPSEGDIAREIGENVDPDAILAARQALRATLGAALAADLSRLHADLASREAYSPDAASAGRRALRNACLDLMVAGASEASAIAARQFEAADNMTDRLAALAALVQRPGEARERALAAFERRFAADPLVLDKWFALQAAIPERETLARVRRLMEHPGFSLSNPNRLRALIGAFANANPSQFHRADGEGYECLAGIVIELDRRNPQVAARLLSAFRTWRTMEPGRRLHAEAALRRVAAATPLSPDVSDIVTRSLA